MKPRALQAQMARASQEALAKLLSSAVLPRDLLQELGRRYPSEGRRGGLTDPDVIPPRPRTRRVWPGQLSGSVRDLLRRAGQAVAGRRGPGVRSPPSRSARRRADEPCLEGVPRAAGDMPRSRCGLRADPWGPKPPSRRVRAPRRTGDRRPTVKAPLCLRGAVSMPQPRPLRGLTSE